VEAYSTLYYDEKIAPVIADERGAEKLSRAANLSLIKMVTARMWANETDEVKEAVRAHMKEKTASERAPNDDGESEEEDTKHRTPEQFQEAIDSMTPILAALGKEVFHRCGWAISIFMGGPVPQAAGAIQVAR
jgi:hypothetical protein